MDFKLSQTPVPVNSGSFLTSPSSPAELFTQNTGKENPSKRKHWEKLVLFVRPYGKMCTRSVDPGGLGKEEFHVQEHELQPNPAQAALSHTSFPALTIRVLALHHQMELHCLCFQTFLGTQHFSAFLTFFPPTLLNRLSPPSSLCHLKICYIE